MLGTAGCPPIVAAGRMFRLGVVPCPSMKGRKDSLVLARCCCIYDILDNHCNICHHVPLFLIFEN
jgi:hypothetical protein